MPAGNIKEVNNEIVYSQLHIEMQPSNCQEIIRDDIRDKAH